MFPVVSRAIQPYVSHLSFIIEAPFAAITSGLRPYIGSLRGSEWNKWDLHVHTPASVASRFGDGQQPTNWTSYLEALRALPPEIKVLGINDYFTIEGYKRVRQAKLEGKLPNIELVLPVVELRLTHLVGNADTSKINLHVLFSDELDPEDIDHRFLQRLVVDLQLGKGPPWHGCIGDTAGLIELGEAIIRATPEDIRSGHSALRVGFANAAVELRTVLDALELSIFNTKYLKAIGLAEWRDMRWDGAGAAQKLDVNARADFVFTASETVAQYQLQLDKLKGAGVNHRLIHASDAHYYADSAEANRLGQTQCWIKADCSFQGLRRALRRFDDRVFVGAMPDKMLRVRANKTKYIKSLRIRKLDTSTLVETWFNNDVPLSTDMVAVIGNQGSGKSALTDILALCGQSKVGEYSFLNGDKFRDHRNRASHFVATLSWEHDDAPSVSLDAEVAASSVERVRYVPQGFFDSVTNETEMAEGGRFYGEIKKVIFSHVPVDERLDSASFDELVKLRNDAAEKRLSDLRAELSEINKRIVVLERECAASEIARVDAEITSCNLEIASCENAKPDEVPAPQDGSTTSAQTQALLEEKEGLDNQIAAADALRGALKRQRIALNRAVEQLQNAERSTRIDVQNAQQQLIAAKIDVDLTALFKLDVDYTPLTEWLTDTDTKITAANELLDPESASSLSARLAGVNQERERLERDADAAASAHQAYLAELADWKAHRAALYGSGELFASTSLAGLQRRRKELTETKPATLRALKEERRAKCLEIHEVLARLASTHENLAAPVRAHIQNEPLARDKYQLEFSVVLTVSSLDEELFQLVGQSSGTFSPVKPGRLLIRQMAAAADFRTGAGAASFADDLLDKLTHNYRQNPPTPFDLADALKKYAALGDVYDLIYGLKYIAPSFQLGLGGKPLRRLSPGERGILLLVFYLVVDRGDEPLIIDQPEGNLNNQAIVEHLVPVIKAAKQRRQIIIVTHNPNIAVVCDAEQIIHCKIADDGTYRVQYATGALENPKFNNLSLDLLEGTAKALGARVETYDSSQ